MMDINSYFDNSYRGSKNPDLGKIKEFLKLYDSPEEKLKCIHIAGTNGKGSCTEMISNILEKQGYTVGKFITPHLINYNERISVNSIHITDEELEQMILELQPKMDEFAINTGVKLSYFEIITIIAFIYYTRKNVDFAVLETGLGGIDDATNIITNTLVSIISSVDYDHIKLLGGTLTEIATKKAGIIKPNSHTVVYKMKDEVMYVINDKCKKENNTLHILDSNNIKGYIYNEDYQYFDYTTLPNVAVNLKGKKQVENASMCIEAMNILNSLGYKVSNEAIYEGLRTVVHKARMEKISEFPDIYYDGAHNAPAMRIFLDMMEMYYKEEKRIYIVSILKRKDYAKMLKILLEDKDATIILTSGVEDKKYATSQMLYEEALKNNRGPNVLMKSLDEALEYAFSKKLDSTSFVIGSFYVYGKVINKIKELKEKMS
ncbi:MAG: hypothetical protein IKK84_04685 [Clostridia bacterium]|nr:hypothetical protein [Clostridia bacterium]MBR6641846.1 hypothetical protein [Clostridia bacterium]